MSHFNCIVITKNGTLDEVNEMLLPYKQCEDGSSPKIRVEEEIRFFLSDYNSLKVDVVYENGICIGATHDEKFNDCWSESFPNAKFTPRQNHVVESLATNRYYKTFIEYLIDYERIDPSLIDGDCEIVKVFTLVNERAKWDYWEIGLRTGDLLIDKDGNDVSSCKIKDVDFEAIKERSIQRLSKLYDSMYDKIVSSKEDTFAVASKFEYVWTNISSHLSVHSILDSNGWHDQQVSDFYVTKSSKLNLSSFIDHAVDKEMYMTIVSCHI